MPARLLIAFGLAGCAAVPALAATAVDVEHGHRIFVARCVVCHGENADGNGQLSKLLDPKPANLRISKLDAGARAAIVRGGGAAVGRSAAMPRWEAELSEDELRAVLAYVDTVVPSAAARP